MTPGTMLIRTDGEACAFVLVDADGRGAYLSVLVWMPEQNATYATTEFDPDWTAWRLAKGGCSDCGGELTPHPSGDPWCQSCAEIDSGPDVWRDVNITITSSQEPHNRCRGCGRPFYPLGDLNSVLCLNCNPRGPNG